MSTNFLLQIPAGRNPRPVHVEYLLYHGEPVLLHLLPDLATRSYMYMNI